MRIKDYPVLTFDTYGTLIDWETGIWDALQPALCRMADPPDRESALSAYAEVEARVQAEPYPLLYSDLLAEVHRCLAKSWGIGPDEAESVAFGRSVPEWPAFADSADALRALKARHKLVTLTNCDVASYRGSDRRLGHPWDAIHTAEDVGSYKPSPKNFEYLFSKVRSEFNAGPESILHIAQSMFHDHVPAKAAGLRTVWIDRRAGRGGGATQASPGVTPDMRFESMEELVRHWRSEPD